MPAASSPATPAERLAAVSQDAPFQNSLGMEFVPAGTPVVLFCVWETRVSDYEEFIQRSGYDMRKGEKASTLERGGWKQVGGDWRNPRFPEPQRPEHPVVCVSLADAKEFCDWLTSKEQRDGTLPSGARYRLPSDDEWSKAVGDATYPWAGQWPPPRGSGNYAGNEANVGAFKSNGYTTLSGYNDSYARTAPVGSFVANRWGLHDMGGNVWEWCDTVYKAAMQDADLLQRYPLLQDEKASDGTPFRVLRGAAWDGGDSVDLRASYRKFDRPSRRLDDVGFRVVLAVSGR